MTTKTSRQPLTADMFDDFAYRDEFLGFGYIGERARHAEDGAADIDIATADALVLSIATELGWDEDRLFAWANSKNGRWFADSTLGCGEFDQRAARLVYAGPTGIAR